MSSVGARLERAWKVLNARERALHLYLSMCEDAEPDPVICRAVPPVQVFEYTERAARVMGVFGFFGPYTEILFHRADALDTRFRLLRVLMLWGGDLDEVRGYLETVSPRWNATSVLKTVVSHGPGFPDSLMKLKYGDAVSGVTREPNSFDGMIKELWDGIRPEVSTLAADLKATEQVLREFRDDLGAGDAMHPTMKEWLELSDNVVASVRDGVRQWEETFDLPEAHVETLRLLRLVLRIS